MMFIARGELNAPRAEFSFLNAHAIPASSLHICSV